MKIIRATTTAGRAGAYYVRIQAMARKHKIPLDEEFDEHDTPLTKYIVVMDDFLPIATCRLYPIDDQLVMFGRIVVLPEYRHQGIGTIVVEEAEKWAIELGFHHALLESRDNKIPFYESMGYVADYQQIVEGKTFTCIRMMKELSSVADKGKKTIVSQQEEDIDVNNKHIAFHQRTFSQLTATELYDILRIRAEVFVVEQNCVYQDLDYDDQNAIHIWLTINNEIVALCRVCPAGTHMQEISIGRVITTYRGKGYGRLIMLAGIKAAKTHFDAKRIDIEAQEYAKGFYEQVGFRQSSDQFMLDGIPHIKMTWKDENHD